MIKLSYITGLREVVVKEIKSNPAFHIIKGDADSLYISYTEEVLREVKQLKSVTRAYLIVQDARYNPAFISHHKSIISDLIDVVLKEGGDEFKSFKIMCAGADSPEVRSFFEYLEETYNLNEKDEADLKIHIVKINEVWEVGIQITPRPLSVRKYKKVHMSGAMDPTIAYALNSFCHLDTASSYLNVCSGSGTLPIEAAQCYPNLKRIVGFDNDKKHLSLSIQNIKEAGLIKRVEVKEFDLLERPDLGTFDAIVSDLPFGMSISKGENLEELYRTFLEYAEVALNPYGRLVVYTSQSKLFETLITESHFKIIHSIELTLVTSVNSYLKSKIIVCGLV